MRNINVFGVKRISFYIALILCIIANSHAHSHAESSVPIRILGVTSGSVYTDFVKPRWYDKGPVEATLKRDSGTPKPFVNGQKITENGNYQLVVTKSVDGITAKTVTNFVINSNATTATILTNINTNGTKLKIRFKGGTFKGHPMYAIWTEDSSGKFIQNLYVSATPATNIMRFGDTFKARPQGLPYWAHKTCPEKPYGNDYLFLAAPAVPIPEDLDAVTGATQKFAYDIETKAHTGRSNSKKIKIYFEINQSWDWGWYFHYDNENHEEVGPARLGDDKYFSKGTGCGEPSLVYMAEIDLEKAHTYLLGGSDGVNKILPIGYSHYAGKTGELYTDFYATDNGVERYKFDHAHKMVDFITVEVIPTLTKSQ